MQTLNFDLLQKKTRYGQTTNSEAIASMAARKERNEGRSKGKNMN